MNASKPFLILQLRPEDDTSNSEFDAILKYGGLDAGNTHRIRIEKSGIPEISLQDYAAIIVGGSPFDITTPQDQKSSIQVGIEADFRRLFDAIVNNDYPFLGACSGCGLLGSYLDTPISTKFAEPVGGTTVNRFCSSGLQSVAMAAHEVMNNGAVAAIGGGAESISMLGGEQNHNPKVLDQKPALYMAMGDTAEVVAKRYNISRQEQDEYSLVSQQRTAKAQEDGLLPESVLKIFVAHQLFRLQDIQIILLQGHDGKGGIQIVLPFYIKPDTNKPAP